MSIEEEMDSIIDFKREKAKESILKECSKVQEAELQALELELSSLRAELKEQLEYFSLDNIRERFFKSSPLSEEIQQSISQLESDANAAIGERFINAYFNKLGKCVVSEKDFIAALDGLSASQQSFLALKSNNITNIMTSLSDKIVGLNLEEENINNTQNTALIIGVGVLTTLSSMFVFPFYSLYLCLVAVMNLRESLALKASLDFLKVIQDNFIFMEDSLTARARIEYAEKRTYLESEYNSAIAEAQKDINSKNQEISDIRRQTAANFRFDTSSIVESVERNVKVVEHDIETLHELLNDKLNQKTQIEDTLSQLNDLYMDSLDKLVEEYLDFNRVGVSKIYPEQILINASDPPEFFKPVASSYLVIYKDITSVQDFIKLYISQLRCNLFPPSCKIQIWDTVQSGVSYLSFVNPNTNGDDCGFSIHASADDLKVQLGLLDDIFFKRIRDIRVSYPNILEYNADMIKLNSVAESYYTVFVLTPELLSNNDIFKRLLLTGPDLGIYIHMFVNYSQLKNVSISLVESVGGCLYLQNGMFKRTATNALIQHIEGEKSNR